MGGKDKEPIMNTEKKAVTDCNDPKELQDAKEPEAKENGEVGDNDVAMVGGGRLVPTPYSIMEDERLAWEEKKRQWELEEVDEVLAARLGI